MNVKIAAVLPSTVFLPLNSLGSTSSLRWAHKTLGDGKTLSHSVIGFVSSIRTALDSLMYSAEPLSNIVIISHIKCVPATPGKKDTT